MNEEITVEHVTPQSNIELGDILFTSMTFSSIKDGYRVTNIIRRADGTIANVDVTHVGRMSEYKGQGIITFQFKYLGLWKDLL